MAQVTLTPLSKPQRVWSHIQLSIFLLAVAFLLTLGLAGAFLFFVSLNIPSISSLSSYNPRTTTQIFDASGQRIADVFVENRTLVPLADMPPHLPQAFVAAEDSRFYQHSGVDAWSIFRALIHNIRTGNRGQGGSTITQQVTRALLLTPEKTYTRKIKEAILAYRIDTALSKDEIIHLYLNQIYLGSGAYGVAAAAQVYFGKPVQELDLAEAALLAGLPQAPSRYSPFRNFELAKKRQAYVLNRMAEEGFITSEEARNAYERTLFWASNQGFPPENEYFLQQVKNYVDKKYGSETMLTGGLRIYTTLDQSMQLAANLAVQRGTEKWLERHGSGATNGPIPQVALVSMEAKTGFVRALVGGTDFGESQFNRATQARRQPGSAFKPFVYAAAIEQGMTPATLIVDEPIRFPGALAGQAWEPKNFGNKFDGPITLRNALVHSKNIVTIKILQQIGVGRAIDLAKRVGISSPLAANLSLALGSSDLSPLELTTAYTPFANSGRKATPIFITKITDATGKVLEENRPALSQALDPRTAFQVTRLLEGVISEGTGRAVSGIGVPAAGKTGTTNQSMDTWFVGYTPTLVTCVWMGHDQKIPLGRSETGGGASAPIWLDFMRQVLHLYPGNNFHVPEGIVMLPLDNATGQQGDPGSKDVSMEAFRLDNLPWQQAEEPEQAPPTEEPPVQ